MRYITALLIVFLLPTTASAQSLQTTPATVQLGTSQIVSPGDASDVFRPGFHVSVRGRLGGERPVTPTLHFGFERRWGSGLDLYGTDLRLGVRSSGPIVFGIEGGFHHRSVQFGETDGLSGSFIRPSVATYAAYRSNRFQIGPEVTATIWEQTTATIGLQLAYVIR